jgi:rhamnogalacturonyl hydrolase YesR
MAAMGAEKGARMMTVELRGGGPYAFPPRGKAYRENAASHRVWRRALIEAPDVIVVPDGEDYGLRAAGVPVMAERPKKIAPSKVHTEQAQRMAQAPYEWMAQLAGQYGQELQEMVYTLSLSAWGRLRAGQVAAVKPILEPFLDGRIDSLAKPTASHYSGHLTLAALFEITGDVRAKERVIAAARMARENPLHNEMSDSVFMVCPLLAKAGSFTGDGSFYAAALRHFDVMRKLCLRADGLYRHSPLDEAAWGRGNAFPLLGLALTLSELSPAHGAFALLREAYAQHADRLLAVQTPDGAWRQVVDKPEAWEEFTATAMIGWAMRRGLRRKWLHGAQYERAVWEAWRAVMRRTGADGTLIDVCESTGKQKSLADYYNREAILGKDPRGGSMALQFAAEMSEAKA